MSRTGVISDRGRDGGFILDSEEGAELGASRCWLFMDCWGWGRTWLEGVEGGRIGAGCRLFVGAMLEGTSLKV